MTLTLDDIVCVNHRNVRGERHRIQERLLQRELQHADHVVEHGAGYDSAVRGSQVPAETVYGTPTATVSRSVAQCVYLPTLLQLVGLLQRLQRRVLQTALSSGLHHLLPLSNNDNMDRSNSVKCGIADRCCPLVNHK